MGKLRRWLFGNVFEASKCQAAAEQAKLTIEKLRKKKLDKMEERTAKISHLRQAYNKVDPTASPARVWAKPVARDRNLLWAYDFIDAFCDLVADEASTIEHKEECPEHLKEAIASLIYAAVICYLEIPELVTLRKMFKRKYGASFVHEATRKTATCRVNTTLRSKLAIRPPSGELLNNIIQEEPEEDDYYYFDSVEKYGKLYVVGGGEDQHI